jgi:crotonobetainyl-CoA:carnitine CoA-transferase CaiB-like acyl-CoA transferase
VNQTARAKNQKELAALLQKVFSTKPAESWIAEFDQRGVPSAPVNDFSEALASPMAQSLNIVRDLPLPNGSSIPTVGFPVKVKGYEFSVYRKPPLLGEHTNEVLQEWKKLSIKV